MKDVLLKYIKTLSSIGTISNKDTCKMLVYMFLYEYNEKREEYGLSTDIVREINKMISCLKMRNCILSNAPFVTTTYNGTTEVNVITTEDGEVITTEDGIAIGY